jgi:hypothetical protein
MFKTPPNDGWLEKAIALENEFEISAGANFQVGAATASTSEEIVGVNPIQTALETQAREAWTTALSENIGNAIGVNFADWAKRFPIKQMKELKFSLPEGGSDAEALLKFFGVSNPAAWESVWSSWTVAYRQTTVRQIRNEAVAAWVRETELSARELQVADYSDERLHAALSELRPLSRLSAERILEPIQKICAAAGVAVVVVPGLPGTGISGCARWLSSRRAMVGLTLRYKTDDQLWFTLFHELAHIVLHRNKRSFVIDNAADDLGDDIVDPKMESVETEANTFARETLIPAAQMSEFLHRKVFTNDSIHGFAEQMQIGPGIVVGRLQHDGVILPHQGNRLKQKLGFVFTEEE